MYKREISTLTHVCTHKHIYAQKKEHKKENGGSDTQGATQGTKRRGGRSGDKQTKGQGWMVGWMDGDGRNYDTPSLTEGGWERKGCTASPHLSPINQNRTHPRGQKGERTSPRVLFPPLRMNAASTTRTRGNSGGHGLCFFLDSLDRLVEIQPFLHAFEQSSRGDMAVIGFVLKHGSTASSKPNSNSSYSCYSSSHSWLVARIAERQNTSWRSYLCSCTGSSWLSGTYGRSRSTYFSTSGKVVQE